LRRIGETVWRDLFEAVSRTHRVLARDPAGAYSRMDFESRERYRKALADLARHGASYRSGSRASCHRSLPVSRPLLFPTARGRRYAARTWASTWWIGGRTQLEAVIGYRPSWSARLPRFILQYPTGFYLTAIELLTLFIVFHPLPTGFGEAGLRGVVLSDPSGDPGSRILSTTWLRFYFRRGYSRSWIFPKEFPMIASPWWRFPRCF
jgi:hypothetical protein